MSGRLAACRSGVSDRCVAESDYGPGHDYTSAVYGSVLAATVVVSAGDLRDPAALATLLLVSRVVF